MLMLQRWHTDSTPVPLSGRVAAISTTQPWWRQQCTHSMLTIAWSLGTGHHTAPQTPSTAAPELDHSGLNTIRPLKHLAKLDFLGVAARVGVFLTVYAFAIWVCDAREIEGLFDEVDVCAKL